jgi:hypothetical protein
LCDAEEVTSHRITFEGPAAWAVGIATALADADGVELTGSDPITKIDDHTVRLGMSVDGSIEAVAAVVAALRSELSSGATITVVDG